MKTFQDPSPIATPAQYRLALLDVRERMTEKHLAMLRIHSSAPEHAVTAEMLADAIGFTHHGTAATQYGTFARWLATALGYAPDRRADGVVRWWRALAYGRPDSAERSDGTFEWVMRPELLEALKNMRWVV